MVGTLKLESSSGSDVQAAAGPPDATAQGSFEVPTVPDYRALGYGCSSESSSGGTPLVSAGPYCQTVYYLDAGTNVLQAFYTRSTNFHTRHGTSVGITAAQAEQREGVTVTSGCHQGIELFSNNPADVLMDIPSSSAVPAATDTVYALEAEAGIGVGLLFC